MLRELFWCLLTSALVTQAAVFSTTIYLHRSATHKALELHPVIAFVFRFCVWITTGLCTKEWVAVHRKQLITEIEESSQPAPARSCRQLGTLPTSRGAQS